MLLHDVTAPRFDKSAYLWSKQSQFIFMRRSFDGSRRRRLARASKTLAKAIEPGDILSDVLRCAQPAAKFFRLRVTTANFPDDKH